MLEVSVKDSGIGMTEEETNKIFNLLTKSNFEGKDSRLSLSLCKQICLSLEGDIEVTSTVAGGSDFRFKMKVLSDSNM